MADALIQASKEGNIDELYELIRKDAAVLKRIDPIMFEDTPLHKAASAGQTCFAMEVMNLMPSFAQKLNKDGLSPMHLALSKGHSELVLLLLRADQKLVRVKGRGGKTPLHYATQIGSIHLLAIFLAACPTSIEDVTVESETVLHIAVKYNMLEALEVLVGWLQRVCHPNAFSWNKYIPNWRDKNGDTVLDFAVSNMQIKAIQLLAEINAKNSKGLGALGTLQGQTQMSRRVIRQMLRKHNTRVPKASLPESTKTLANYLRSNTKSNEKIAVFYRRVGMQISQDVRSALIMVFGVFLGAAMQAFLSPPAVDNEENDNPNIVINGTSINTTLSNTTSNGGSPSNDEGESVMDFVYFMAFSKSNFFLLLFVFYIIGLVFPNSTLFVVYLIILSLYTLTHHALIYEIDYIFCLNMISKSLFFLFLLYIIVFLRQGFIKIEQIRYTAVKCPKEAVAEEAEESGARTTSNESGAQTVTFS